MSTNFPGIHTLNPSQFDQLLGMVQSSDCMGDVHVKELFDESIAFNNLKASCERSADNFLQECLSTSQYDKAVALLKKAPPFNAAMLLQTLFTRALTSQANDDLLDRIQIERTVRFAIDWVERLDLEPDYRAHIGDLKERLDQAQRGLIAHSDAATAKRIGKEITERVEAVRLAILSSIDQSISAEELPYKSEAEREAEEQQLIADLLAGRAVPAPCRNSILLPSGRVKPATDLEMVVENPNRNNVGERFEQLLAFLFENHSSSIGAIVTALMADPHNEALGRQIMSQFEYYLIPLFSQSSVTFSQLFDCGFPIEMGPSLVYRSLTSLEMTKRKEENGEPVPLSYLERLQDTLWYIQFLHDVGRDFQANEDILEGRSNLHEFARSLGLHEAADLIARLNAARQGFSAIQRA